MKGSVMNSVAVLFFMLAIALAGCSPTVQSTGPKKDPGVEKKDTGGTQGDSSSEDDYDVELSDADFEVDEDAEWEGPGEDQDAEWDPDDNLLHDKACDKKGLKKCFLNSDCENPADSCQNVDEEMPTTCCAPGKRGDLKFGDSCGGHGSEDANNQACASGLCLDNGTKAICTERCDDETGECSNDNSECVGIAGLGGVCIPSGFEL